MRELGIKPEHECFDAGHVANLDPLIDMGLVSEPHQISLVMGVTGGIRPTPRNVAFMAEQIPGGPDGRANWQVIGVSRDQWKLLAASLVLGGNVRAGLEDNLYLPDGEMARSNGDLIAQGAPDGRGRRPPRGDGRRGPRDARACRSARRPGHDRPSSDVRILDLSRLLPGGFCSLLLADLGADVIKVEDTRHGRLRALGAALLRRRGARSRSARARRSTSRSTAASARSASTSSRTRDARPSCGWRASADVVLESFRPGVLDRLGVGYERLREVNPRIVYCAITGYGLDGPNTARAGHDTNYLGAQRPARPDRRRRRPAGLSRPARSPTSAAAR